MPARVPVLVLVVAGLDFLAWRWASGSDDTIAMVAGVALVPLIILLLWTAVLAVLSALLRFGQGAHRRLSTPAQSSPEDDRSRPESQPRRPRRRRGVRAARWRRRRRRADRSSGRIAA